MKRSTSLIVALIVVFIALCAAHASAAPLPERVRAAAQARVDAGQYPALVIAYVDGTQSKVDVFGKLDDGRAPDGDTVFEIGSLTKTFTATLLAQEVEAGRLKLDTPIADLLGGWKLPSRSGKAITLLDLADQHSGLPRLPTNLAPADAANPYADYDTAKLKAFLADYTLPRDPGASYEYSNLGFGLLGFALAKHARMSYAQLLETRLLRPLGMRMSSTTLTDAMRAHLARGHGGDGQPVENWTFDTLAGCGAARSTANDLLLYLRANMAAAASDADSAMKLAQKPRRDLRKDERIGLAWMTRKTKAGDVIWHNGMTGGYASALGFNADGKRGAIVLTNIASSVDDLAAAALDADAPLAPARKAVALDAATLADYVGQYQLAPNARFDITVKDGQLHAQLTGQPAFPVYATARDRFRYRVVDAQLDFERDGSGKVVALTLHQNGQSPRAPRVTP